MKGIIILSLLVLLSSSVFGGDWVSSQVTFKYSDDNIFETSRRSNFARFGDTETRLFNENLNTYKTGDETESQLVIYKKFDGYITGLTTDAALVFNLSVFNGETGDVDSSFREDGSYVRIKYKSGDNNFSILAFPYNSDRFLLGWTYDLTWGSQSMWPKSKINKNTPVPGIKIDWNNKFAGLFIGAKTRPANVNLLEKDNNGDYQTNDTIATTWGIMGGGYFDFAEMLRLDIHTGLFNKGTNPLQSGTGAALENEHVFGSEILAKGVSGRISFRQNTSLSVSKVMKVYQNLDKRNDLKNVEEEEKTKSYTGLGYVVSLEGVYLTQPLRNADNREELIDFNAWAMDFKVSLAMNDLKINMDFIMRNPQFLLFNVPGLTAFEAISTKKDENGNKTELTNEMFFSIGGDYKTTEHLNLGFLFGYKLPASYKGASTDYVLVIKDREDQSSFTSGLTKNKVRLPSGEDAKPILAFKLSAFYELSKGMELSGEVSYLVDQNDSTVDEAGKRVLRSDDETHKLGFALYIRSNF